MYVTGMHRTVVKSGKPSLQGSIFYPECTKLVLQTQGCDKHKLHPAYALATAQNLLTHQVDF